MIMDKQALLEVLRRHPKPDCLLPVSPQKREQILNGEVYRDYLGQMQKQGELYRSKTVVTIPYGAFKLFETTGDRKIYQGYYFDNRGRVATLALLVWLYEKEEDIHALEDAVWSVCDEYTWALPAHLGGQGLSRLEDDGYTIDLFAGETACLLSEVMALVGDRLAPIVVKRARYLVETRVLDRMLEAHFNWEKSKNNWAAVCAGSVGIAAMYETDGEKLAALLERMQAAMESYVSSFPADGTSMEGISYWTYGFAFFTAYAEMLFRRTEGEIDWFKDKRVHQIALFQQKAYFEGGNIIKFADCNPADTTRWWGLTSYMKSRYPDVDSLPRPYFSAYTGDACYRWAGMLRDLAWSDESLDENHKPDKNYILPDAQWLICNGKNGVSFAAKGGTNNESHNHNDVGTFELFKNGEEMLIDYGGGMYSRAYFSETRYDQFVCGSQGHNVPIVEGKTQLAGPEYGTGSVSFGEWWMEMDLAPAYGNDNLRSLVRRIDFDTETGKTTIKDSFAFASKPTSIVERFVTRAKAEICGDTIRLTGEKATLTIRFDPSKLKPGFGEGKAQSHLVDRPETMFTVDFEAIDPAANCTFEFVIE